MAKDKAKSESHGSRAYVFAAILVLLMYLANSILVDRMYAGSRKVSDQTSSTMQSINRMNSELSEVNNNVLSIVAGVGNRTGHANAAAAHFANINECIENFESIESLPDEAKRRFNHAKLIVQNYNKKLLALRDAYNQTDEKGNTLEFQAFDGGLTAVYTQDIYPLQVTAQEMLLATIDMVNKDADRQEDNNKRTTYILMVLMLLVAVLSELAILIFAKRSKKSRLELEEREKNLREVDAKLKSTRQKASDLAVMNILTGMKNRYALDNDISERLESDRFNIAVFDMDNFRSINDTYGYDFGDEYLIAVADRLKNEFGSMAEIYNITGNEFCFVFNKEISESQAMGIVQNIHAVMCSPYEVLNLTVQLPTSGSVYHYLPGDCLNVNSLLVKLDTALRNAKLNGGNMINTVVDI